MSNVSWRIPALRNKATPNRLALRSACATFLADSETSPSIHPALHFLHSALAASSPAASRDCPMRVCMQPRRTVCSVALWSSLCSVPLAPPAAIHTLLLSPSPRFHTNPSFSPQPRRPRFPRTFLRSSFCCADLSTAYAAFSIHSPFTSFRFHANSRFFPQPRRQPRFSLAHPFNVIHRLHHVTALSSAFPHPARPELP